MLLLNDTFLLSVMTSIYSRIYVKLQNCVGIHSGQGDLIMLVNIIPGLMRLDSSVIGVIMTAIMGDFFSIGMLRL